VLVLAASATAGYFHAKGERRTGGKLAATAAIPATSPSTPGTAAGLPFLFTVPGWSDGRLRVADSSSVSTAYQTANVYLEGAAIGILTVYRPGSYNTGSLDGAQPITLAGRSARWDETYPISPNDTSRLLAWQYADNAWATMRISDDSPSYDQLRSLASGLRTEKPVAARSPFTMSYVPKGYHAVEVGTQVQAGTASPGHWKDDLPAAVVFAQPAPKPTGLVGPWDPESENSENPIANNFLISVAFGSIHKVGTSGCLDGFCYLWTGDGRTRIDVVSYDRLPDREALRVLKGIKLAPMDNPGAWFDANTALQAGR
jgi:hypothetical protein